MTALERFVSPAFVADARSRVSSVWRKLFETAGKYEPFSPQEKEIVCVDKIGFAGDAPVQIVGGVHEQGRMAFRRKRPLQEQVSNLVVTPKGAGWKDGCLYERYSAGAFGLRAFLEKRRPRAVFENGYYIQAAHKDTYGDWVSEYLTAIARARPLSAPLFLPAALASRHYVQRDLASMGVEFVAVDKPVEIRSAIVLRQQKFFVHFDKAEVAALRTLFGVEPAAPRPESLVYFSRRGEVSEVAHRTYPHDVVERVVAAHGGRVVETVRATPEDYLSIAGEAETVIFDHGSAIYNALHWRPRRLIEIVSDNWWNNAFLMLGDAMGVDDYTIIRGSLDAAHVAKRLEEALARPLDRSRET